MRTTEFSQGPDTVIIVDSQNTEGRVTSRADVPAAQLWSPILMRASVTKLLLLYLDLCESSRVHPESNEKCDTYSSFKSKMVGVKDIGPQVRVKALKPLKFTSNLR